VGEHPFTTESKRKDAKIGKEDKDRVKSVVLGGRESGYAKAEGRVQ
jgi:hypothetical protein